MNSFKEYLDLLSKTYEEAVDFLLQKYGPAHDDYFREKSYQRFMNGEIKNIAKGKISRTNEGLYCHHIDEIKWLKVSDKDFVKRFNIPFECQRKDRLVYCDLVEHSILHVLITKETSFEFGYPGYELYLKPIIEDWYLNKAIPKTEWMKNCYNTSYLEAQEAFNILKGMQKTLGKGYFNTLLDYYEEIKKKEEERIKWLKQLEQARINERDELIKRAKQLHSKSPRKNIVAISYSIYIEYKDPKDIFKRNIAVTYEEYDSKKKKYTKEKILEDLLIYIESLQELG
ncbi:hypothetical protein [Oceanobacillus arenosus]|uniref:hypothetical protein n=1 Tax=Oceanobacillus arenosus TaxID=1229153 RepID=UPI001B86C2AA|nr:hypothetical protein [Oceanobacillus arenosus]